MRKLAILLLISVIVEINLAVDQQQRDADEMELLFDPGLPKEHITLNDDYGIKPIPPQIPPFRLRGQGTHNPNLDEEYF